MSRHCKTEKRRKLLSLVATFAFAHVALAELQAQGSQASVKDEQVVLTSTSNESGNYEYRVSSQRLALTKNWSPESELPPLSIAAAVSLAKKNAHLARPQDFQLIGIELRPYPVDWGGGVRWYYRIDYYNAPDAYRDNPPSSKRVVMLMDGSIIEPVRATKSSFDFRQ